MCLFLYLFIYYQCIQTVKFILDHDLFVSIAKDNEETLLIYAIRMKN